MDMEKQNTTEHKKEYRRIKVKSDRWFRDPLWVVTMVVPTASALTSLLCMIVITLITVR